MHDIIISLDMLRLMKDTLNAYFTSRKPKDHLRVTTHRNLYSLEFVLQRFQTLT